ANSTRHTDPFPPDCDQALTLDPNPSLRFVSEGVYCSRDPEVKDVTITLTRTPVSFEGDSVQLTADVTGDFPTPGRCAPALPPTSLPTWECTDSKVLLTYVCEDGSIDVMTYERISLPDGEILIDEADREFLGPFESCPEVMP
ncbi:MAG: hypothetical protein AAGA48_40435, partial [Myxococcota bacterium]